MTRSDHQWAFLLDLARLIQWAEDEGYKLTGGDLFRDPRAFGEWGSALLRDDIKTQGGTVPALAPYGDANSQHKLRLAIDLNLFERRNGRWVYLSSTESHRLLGEHWESLSPHNRWGGRFKDGNHYERLERERDSD